MFKWIVKDVEPRTDFTLLITFAKGKKKLFDCKKFLFDDSFSEKLKDLNFFMKAKADHNTVMWDDDIDISPEYLYDKSIKYKKKSGFHEVLQSKLSFFKCLFSILGTNNSTSSRPI